MNAQHTPGPWKYHLGRGKSPRFHVQTPAGYQIASTKELNSGAFEENESTESDARLIASAPELLEALEGLLPDFDATDSPDGSQSVCRWCGRVFDMGQDNCDSDDCPGVKARCAIAKARGQA